MSTEILEGHKSTPNTVLGPERQRRRDVGDPGRKVKLRNAAVNRDTTAVTSGLILFTVLFSSMISPKPMSSYLTAL